MRSCRSGTAYFGQGLGERGQQQHAQQAATAAAIYWLFNTCQLAACLSTSIQKARSGTAQFFSIQSNG
jgi:hypothetical protein